MDVDKIIAGLSEAAQSLLRRFDARAAGSQWMRLRSNDALATAAG